MIRLVLLALILTTPAHAERWCNGTLTSNNVCESNVPPVIVRCDYTLTTTVIRGVLALRVRRLFSPNARRESIKSRLVHAALKEKPTIVAGEPLPSSFRSACFKLRPVVTPFHQHVGPTPLIVSALCAGAAPSL
jgi:hypothetical protein